MKQKCQVSLDTTGLLAYTVATIVLLREILMSTVLKRQGTFLLGVLVGAMLSVSAGIISMERVYPVPITDTYRTMPENIDSAIDRGYRPTHLESDLKLT